MRTRLAGLADAAFEHEAHAQFAADLLHIDCAALVGEARIAGDHEEPADAAQCGGDLRDHAVGEIFLLRVAAQIGEGQDRNRRLVRQCQRQRCRYRRFSAEPDAPDMDRTGNFLDQLLAQILERKGELVAHLVADNATNANSAGFGQGLEPCRDIDPVARCRARP